jgi:conjugal transfer pilus assembly protein TraW
LWILSSFLALATLLSSSRTLAKDGGHVGPTYPIAEEDGIDAIKKTIRKKNPEEIKKKFMEEIKREGEVNLNIPATTVEVSLYFEPKAVLSRDILDANGRLLYLKGTEFKPIEKMLGRKTYLIFDGLDSKQVAWINKNRSKQNPVILIAVKGNVFDLANLLHAAVYPAKREIVEALRVSSVPSRITQEGKWIHVEAVMP